MSAPLLIETLLWDGRACVREARHLRRLARSARALGYPCDEEAAARALREGRDSPARLRLTLDASGAIAVTAGPVPPPAALWRVAVHPGRVRADDPWLRHKTTRRPLYDEARAGLPRGLDEWVFLNEEGYAAEGAITTLFFDRGPGEAPGAAGGWRTPPLACGCLPGVLREAMLEEGRAREEALRGDELPHVRLAMGNSLRGLVPAELVPLA